MLIKFKNFFSGRCKLFQPLQGYIKSYQIIPELSTISERNLNFVKMQKCNYTKTKSSINFDTIHQILQDCKLDPKFQTDNNIRTRYCPLCDKPHYDDPTNMNTFMVYKSTLIYFCFRCGNKGHIKRLLKILSKKYNLSHYKDLLNNLDGYSSNGNTTENEDYQSDFKRRTNSSNNNYSEEPIQRTFDQEEDIFREPQETTFSNNRDHVPKIQNKFTPPSSFTQPDNFKISLSNTNLINELYRRNMLMWNPKCSSIVDYLINERKLTLDTLKFYKVGVSFEKFKSNSYDYINLPCVTYPMFYPTNKNQFLTVEKGTIDDSLYEYYQCDKFYLSKVKIRAIGKEFKHFQRIEPFGAVINGLFGLDTVPDNADEVIITEGEYDAMAAYQELKMPCISLPNGATNLPTQVLPYFQRFKKIYLWMDADQPGQIAAENFAKKLGEKRTFIINTLKDDPNGPKDANDALKAGKDFREYIRNAKPLSGDNIIRMSDIKSEILQFLSKYDKYSGYQSTSFAFFNNKLKGLRMGEFSIFTGETGSGKTTFLSQLSLDFIKQGVPTLWGSFEIKNDKLASLFLMQSAKKNLRLAPIQEIEYVTENFEKLPLYMLKFHGSQNMDEIINSMNYAVYNYDIQNIILDNLQFMIGMPSKITNKFDFQDEIIFRLRKFATEKNVHLTLVIHPRKDEVLKISSIFGTGKASQEADNIYILQTYKGLRILEIAKNRFDGTTGKVAIGFDQNSCRFFELTMDEFSKIAKENSKLDDIINERLQKYGKVEFESEGEHHSGDVNLSSNKKMTRTNDFEDTSMLDSVMIQKEKQAYSGNMNYVSKDANFENDVELFGPEGVKNNMKAKAHLRNKDIVNEDDEFDINDISLQQIKNEIYSRPDPIQNKPFQSTNQDKQLKPENKQAEIKHVPNLKINEEPKKKIEIPQENKQNAIRTNEKINTEFSQQEISFIKNKSEDLSKENIETLNKIQDFQTPFFPSVKVIDTFHSEDSQMKTSSNAQKGKPIYNNRMKQSTYRVPKDSYIDDMF